MVDKQIDDLKRLLDAYTPEELNKIEKAYNFAKNKHQGQFRKSGEPYYNHPLSVAYILAKMNMDVDSVVSGLLHDTLEDTETTKAEIESIFGKNVAFLVDSLTKISKIQFKSKEQKQAENFRKMLISMSQDIRVILIKLADRLHNMRTIQSLRPDKQIRIANETINIYAPIAHRLGIAWIKWELEDLCFRVLNPEQYDEINRKVVHSRGDLENYINKIIILLKESLEKDGLISEIYGRPKHFYSIYSKMLKKNLNFEDIHDLIAIRVIVNSSALCYGVLGVIHNLFKPVPNRFKDYIAMPKPNMYQSLHTTVLGPHGHMIEFQIRTPEMHTVAEEGIAAHWSYKENKSFDTSSDKRFVWLRNLIEQKGKDSEALVESLVEDVLPAQIYVFTPNGDVMELPEGATPIDFAYCVHSKVGDTCIGAKINDTKVVSLKYKLHNGDIVSISTSPGQQPRKDWLSFVKTTKAKTRIRAFLRKQDGDKAIESGYNLLDVEFKKYNFALKETVDNQESLKRMLDKAGFKTIEELLQNVGFRRVSPIKILHLVHPSTQKYGLMKGDEPEISKASKQSSTPFIISNIDNIMTKIAKCCNPLPGDNIVGYISTARGIIIHKNTCENLKDPAINVDRLVNAVWDESKGYKAPVKYKIISDDSILIMNNISAILKDLSLNLLEYSSKATNTSNFEQTFSVEVKNSDEAKFLYNKLAQLKGVIEIEAV